MEALDRDVNRVRDEIFRVAKKRGIRAEELIKAYVRERFLHCLSRSSLRNTLTLKGGQLIQVWGQGRSASHIRPTKDLDLSILEGDPSLIVASIRETLKLSEGADGIRFGADSIDVKYMEGSNTFRVRVPAFLGKTPAPIWVDVGLSDETFPDSALETLPPVLPGLGLSHVSINCYPKEAVISEKYHAMVSWGEESSRLKDYYDIWLLAGMFEFEGRVLQKSIEKTFGKRMTEIQVPDELFTESLILKCAPRWDDFVNRLDLSLAFEDALIVISRFIGPILAASRSGSAFDLTWRVKEGLEGNWSV